jgi:hypothetical protein
VDIIFDDDQHYIEAATDDTTLLPVTGIVTGSKAVVVPTGDVLMFSEASGQWVTEFTLQG